MLLLENRVVLVTGASRGIGRAFCELFASEGALVYAGIRDETVADEIKKTDAAGGQIIPVLLDVCSKDSIRSAISSIKRDSGKLDVLVNNAGLTIIERLEMVSDKSVEAIFDTNVVGLLHVTQMAIRLLKKSDFPSIINMSSIEYENSDIGQTVYSASKGAVTSMTKTWAKEYAPIGLRVNAIAPGNIDTDMFNVADEETKMKAIAKIGMGRLGRPEEVAKVGLFLSSKMASYVTGEVIGVNGALVL